ncbi:glycosyltransferase [Flavihumibacter sp. CACIAM 22H1]|uniref:glycosyltransferase n=1 Tax=Flavihumibacter sp. CACIAM 22H1 TaxID=1812911 RepID=UPI000AFE8803|nr:glycosyltransferase [Flavihumibacter sp. CACIAM 22H1]
MALINLAIVSPNQQQYSETFIEFHKSKLPAKILFLYGGYLPVASEDKKLHYSLNRLNRLKKRLWRFILPNSLDPQEKAVYTYLVSNNVQAVLAEYGMTGAALQKVCKAAKLPLLVHFHGYDATNRLVVNPLRSSYLSMFSYASAVFVVSKHMKKVVADLGCPDEKMVLNTYGPSDIYFKVEPDYSRRAFLAIGRFVEKKAPDNTIKAFYQVVQKYPGTKLHMVGAGPLLDTCVELAASLGISEAIQFHGVQSPDKIAALMQEVTAFVQHSVTASDGDSEGTPVAVLESAAAALPVVATLHAGIPDVILDGKTGYLCAEHDIDAMAGNMMKILENPTVAKNMGELSRQRIREHFTLEKHISRIYSSIEEAVKNSKPIY